MPIVNFPPHTLFGQSLREATAVFEPFMGRRLLAGWCDLRDSEPARRETWFAPRREVRLRRRWQRREVFDPARLPYEDIAFEFEADAALPAHLCLGADYQLRFAAPPEWALRVSAESMAEAWGRYFRERAAGFGPGRDLLDSPHSCLLKRFTLPPPVEAGQPPPRLVEVWAAPHVAYRPEEDTYYLPISEGLALGLETDGAPGRRFFIGRLLPQRDDLPAGWFHGPQLPPAPGEQPWTMILSTATRGMERIQQAFAAMFREWRFELPVEDVALRRDNPAFDDGADGITGWSIAYRFGRDAAGEYLDVESDHRHCGPSRHRLHADGREEDLGVAW